MRMLKTIPILSLCLALTALARPARAASPDAAGVEFFESKVRPVLADHCYKCHSAEAQANKKLKGGLLVDSREGLLKGGDGGPAVVPGSPETSKLIEAVKR